jgi:hypothetical protein
MRSRGVSVSELPPDVQRKARALVGKGSDDAFAVELGPNSPLLGRVRCAAAVDREHPIQCEVVAWADDPATLPKYPELKMLYAIPNWFGKHTDRQGARAKREGRRDGMPDLCVPVPRRVALSTTRVYGALYVEMKAENGTVRKSQRDRIAALRAAGNRCEVAMSADAAKAIITQYLELPPP